jgi:rhodanese-related sulfurtransferase
MKDTGTFDFRLGEVSGTLTVVAYQGPGYQELTAQEAQEVLETQDPLLLDVRTRGEFQRGHLKNAMLIPIQELQRRFSELEKYKNQPILIYCATGNRSTVAAKILIDQGFEHISNLRYGIVDWQRRRLPVEGPLRP